MTEIITKPKLNKAQQTAVEYGDGPLLLVAGAGTGKTTVITERIAWLIKAKEVKSDEILALTFTDKAAGEMEERVDKALPYGYTDLWVMTFHSFCDRILQAHGLDIGLPNNFKLLTPTDAWLLVRENLDKFDLDYYKPLGNPTKFIHALLKHFSRAKDENISPKDYLSYAEDLQINLDKMESGSKTVNKKQLTGNREEESDEMEIRRLNEIAKAYHIYNQLLLDNEALDFGDLINYTLRLFSERPNILKIYQHKFKYILVDEFQDTNYAQYELVKLLAGDRQNLTVVGDDDQCLPGDALIDLADGVKKIKDIKVGDQVITAVGKGHLSMEPVSKIFKNSGKKKFLTIKLKSGQQITLTDNHKVFCHVPTVSDKKYFYVYLMFRQNLGWRLGTTNDLISRLRLERSADSIIALRAFSSDTEARYFETLWSLKYSIPTVCCQARGNIVMQGNLLKNLYKDLDVYAGVHNLVSILGIDLSAPHYSLNAVYRGQSCRLKINLEMCHRKYRSKEHVQKGKNLMTAPTISHLLSLETSNSNIIKKLKANGFTLTKAKKGCRLRLMNQNLVKLGTVAKRLEKITGGFVETRFKLGKIKYQHLSALVLPAKNLVLGLYLPIRQGSEVIYDQIVDIKAQWKSETVYDLEVAPTHNFIADDVVVHNSIYKFRGASVSNILQFKDDYSKSTEIYLKENYRSTQNILDLAYNFIQLNNPERLEVKLGSKQGLSKKLNSNSDKKGTIEHLHLSDENLEIEAVINKIIELKNEDKNATWNDFAILVRANSQADGFTTALKLAGIPYNFVASKGLYTKEIILNIFAYLKLLDNYHESLALWRILNLDNIKIPPEDLMEITRYAQRKTLSIYETLKQLGVLSKVSAETKTKVDYILKTIARHTELAKQKNLKEIIHAFLTDFKLKEKLLEQAGGPDVIYINQLLKKVDEFTRSTDEPTAGRFIEQINYEMEAGEAGDLPKGAEEGPEAVKVMTIHAAKGLEFKYVFVVNLVDKRFPTIERRDPIELPDALVKEIIPEGDIHLQEERRLFYVALTRAKEGLFLTSADNYGGKTKKKLSRFLFETGLVKEQENNKSKKQKNKELVKTKLVEPPQITIPTVNPKVKPDILPKTFSFSQLKAFVTCPYQYYLSFILKIPTPGKAVFSYGKTMHNTLQTFMLSLRSGAQGDLFGKSKEVKLPSVKTLLEIYQNAWIDEWYADKKQKEDYKTQGEKSLREFYIQIEEKIPAVLELEKGFNFKLGDYTIKGTIDRVDKLSNGKVEIIDYKTGSAKDAKSIAKDQLLIYQMAAEEVFGWDVDKLTFYYLNNNTPVSFLGTNKDIEKQKAKMLEIIKQILTYDFTANPSDHNCRYCDFNSICQFKY